jgi:RHS repeat-associated protein
VPGRLQRLSLGGFTQGTVGVEVPSADGATVDVFQPWTGVLVQRRAGQRGNALAHFGYSPQNQLDDITDADGNNMHVARPNTGTITITSDTTLGAGARVTTLTVGANGYLERVTHPDGTFVSLTHQVDGLLTSFRDERNNAHTLGYDADGRLVSDVDARVGSSGQTLSRIDYPSGYDVTLTSAERRPRVHGVRFDGVVRPGDPVLLASTAEELRFTRQGSLETRSYTRSDRSTWSIWPDGTTVDQGSMSADPRRPQLWFPSSVTTKRGTLSRTETETRTALFATPGDPFSLTSFTNAWTVNGARTTQSVYSAPVGATPASWLTTSAAGRPVKVLLDGRERVTRVEVGSELHPIDYAYDLKGRLETVTQGTRVWQTTYDGATGWPTQLAAPGPLTTTFTERDGRGRPKTVVLPGGRTLGLGYDSAGNLTSVTPPESAAHGFAFDANNRLASYAPPALAGLASPAKDTLYARDFDGLVTRTSVSSDVATAAFDALKRPTAATVNSNPRSLGYDASGRLATVTAGPVTLTNTAFQGSLVTGTTMAISGMTGSPVTLSRTYNNFFELADWNVASTVTTNLPKVQLAYDADGLVSSAYTVDATRLNFRRSAQAGLVTGAWWGATSGETTSQTSTPWTESATWSTYGELATYAAKTAPSASATAPVYALALLRDDAGRITKKTETVGATSPVTTVTDYGYDGAGRLATEAVDNVLRGTWLYDGNGNRFTNTGGTRTGATYDAQDRLITLGSASFTYSDNGELTSKTVAGATTSFTYDLEGNLRSVTLPGTTGGIAYTVDGFGHRVRRVRTGSITSSRAYLWDGDRLVAELDAAGAVVSRFVYATQGHSPDLMVTSSGTFRLVKDHLGSVRLVVNVEGTADAAPRIAQRIDYDAWGNIDPLTATAPTFQPFGFAGGIQDRDTGFVRFGARDYDPQSARWTSKDRSRFRGGLNLAAYCNQDPVNLVDPTGRTPAAAGILAAGAAGGAAGSAIFGPLGAGLGIGFGALGCALGVWCAPPDAPKQPSAPPAPGSGGAPGVGALESTGSSTDSGGGICLPKPTEQDRDCTEECTPYLGKNKVYHANNGLTYRNDSRGNAQYAYYACLEDCEGAK